MGRTKSRIGRFPKNYEKHLAQKRVGRPAKKKLQTPTLPDPTEVSVTALSDLTDTRLPSNQWTIQNHLPDNVVICKISSRFSCYQLLEWNFFYLRNYAKTHWSHSSANKEQPVEEMITLRSSNFATTQYH